MVTTELVVLCLIGIFVIGINVSLFQAIRRSGRQGELELLRKAARRARKPWEPETASMEELSRLVAPFKEPEADPPEPVGTGGEDHPLNDGGV